MLVLGRKQIEEIIDMRKVVEVVEAAFRSHGLGQVSMPPKLYLSLPQYGGDFRAMPAFVNGAAGVKWVNSHPGNPKTKNLPTVMAVLIYNDPATGLPLAVMDATLITKYRTAAASAIAVKHLARKGARTVGMIGCGAQAGPHLTALQTVMNIEEVFLYDADSLRAQALAREFNHLKARVKPLAEVAKADVICTITPGYGRVLESEWVRPGAHINAVGADAPEKQELDPKILNMARVFVDDVEQACHSGEISGPIEAGTFAPSDIAGTLGQVVAGLRQGRTSDADITLFDSTGLAIQDVSTARYVYEEALKRGVGLHVDLL